MRLGNIKTAWSGVLGLFLAAAAVAEPTSTIGAALPDLRLTGHQDSIIQLDWSADGKWIASASADKTVRIWDATTGKTKHRLDGWRRMISELQFSGDGKRLIVGSLDGTARVFDLTTGKMLTRIVINTPVFSVAISPDGKTAAVGSGANIPTTLYDVATEKRIGVAEEPFQPSPMVFSPDGKQVAMSAMGMQGAMAVKIMGLDGKVVRSFDVNETCGLSYSADGKHLYHLGRKGVGRIDLEKGENEVVAPWHGIMQLGRFFASDYAFCVGAHQGSVSIYAIADPKLPAGKISYAARFVRTVAMSPDGSRVAAGVGLPPNIPDISNDAYYGVGLPPGEAEIQIYKTKPPADAPVLHPINQPDRGVIIAVVPGTNSALIAGRKNTERVDLESGKVLASLPGRDGYLPPTYSADGKLELIRKTNVFNVIDTANGNAVKPLGISSVGKCSAAFAGDGRSVYIGVEKEADTPIDPKRGSIVGGLHQIDLETKKIVMSFDTQGTEVRSVAVDGKLDRLIAVTGRHRQDKEGRPGLLRVYDTKSGKQIGQVSLGEKDLMYDCRGIVISADHIAYAAAIGSIQRFDLSQGKPLPHIELSQGVYAQLALSADQKQLFALASDHATLVDRNTLMPVYTWRFPRTPGAHIGFKENKPFMATMVDGKSWEFRWLEQTAR